MSVTPHHSDELMRIADVSLQVLKGGEGELFQQALSNSKLHVIARCGHSPALEKPQEFLQVAQAFLSRQN